MPPLDCKTRGRMCQDPRETIVHGRRSLQVPPLLLVLTHEILTLAFSPDADGCEPFPQSFDFSKLPNLQEVDFRIGWMGGGLVWIPKVLSTLRPTTSPRLSTIQLNFTRPYTANRSVETTINVAGDDLRWVADEVARIEREFWGAVEVNVHLDSSFEALSNALNVRGHFYGVGSNSELC